MRDWFYSGVVSSKKERFNSQLAFQSLPNHALRLIDGMKVKKMKCQHALPIKKIYKKNGARGRNRTGMVLPPRDFKSLASTCFATWAIRMEAEAGIGPAYAALQAAA